MKKKIIKFEGKFFSVNTDNIDGIVICDPMLSATLFLGEKVKVYFSRDKILEIKNFYSLDSIKSFNNEELLHSNDDSLLCLDESISKIIPAHFMRIGKVVEIED